MVRRVCYTTDMEVSIQDNERLDDLQYAGLRLIQRPGEYCFTSDAVLLSNYARVRAGGTIVDLGTGNGVIALLVAAKTAAAQVVGIELQPEVARLAQRNVVYNGLQARVRIVQGDVANAAQLLGKECAQTVVTNPPYFPMPSGLKRATPSAALSRHESSCDLNEWIRSAADLLQWGGSLYMIHKTERMAEVLSALTARNLAPKRVTLIFPKASKQADTFIVQAKKGGKHGMRLDTLIVFEESGAMTADARKLYHKSDSATAL